MKEWIEILPNSLLEKHLSIASSRLSHRQVTIVLTSALYTGSDTVEHQLSLRWLLEFATGV